MTGAPIPGFRPRPLQKKGWHEKIDSKNFTHYRIYFVFIVWRSTHRQFFLFPFMRFHANSEVQKCAWNKIILLRVHALLRDPLRGGRDHFTEIKFNQIRSRCAEFGQFLTKVVRFEGFSRFVFHLIFKICWNLQYL